MIRFSYSDPFVPHRYKQQLVFRNKLHDRKWLPVHLWFSVGHFVYFVCVVQKSDEFLTSYALCAASLNQWRESSFSWFLLLLRTDSSSVCILNKVQRKRGRNVWLISKCGQNCLLFILQLILEPFTRTSGMFCCLAPASRVQHRVRALSEGWYLSYGSGKWGALTTGVCISPQVESPGLFSLWCVWAHSLRSAVEVFEAAENLALGSFARQWLIDTRLLLRVLHLQKHNLHSSGDFCLLCPCTSVPEILFCPV